MSWGFRAIFINALIPAALSAPNRSKKTFGKFFVEQEAFSFWIVSSTSTSGGTSVLLRTEGGIRATGVEETTL